MYIVKGNYIFFHIPKTGGKSIYQYFLRRGMLELATEHTKYSDFIKKTVTREYKPIEYETYLMFSEPEPASGSLRHQVRVENENKQIGKMETIIDKFLISPNIISKNYKLFATIRNPIDWYISFYHHNKSMATKLNNAISFTNICNLLSFEEFIKEFVEKTNIGLYTKIVSNFTMPVDFNLFSRATYEEKELLYNNFDELYPITFLKMEDIKKEMLKYIPEICSDLKNSEFLHVNQSVVGPPTSDGRKKYLDFFEKSRELLLQKYDIIREKDALIFERADY